MKIDQLNTDGLKQSYKVLIEASEIEKKVKRELERLKSRVALKGFRPGKTPLKLLEKTHGKAVRGQLLEKMVKESIERVYADHQIKPAMRPNVEILKFEEASDLEFKIEVEVLPKIQTPDLAKIKLEKLVAKADAAAVAKVVERLLKENKQFTEASAGAAAAKGDAVVIDFVGRVGGKKFEGAETENFQLELGSGAFVPGFEAGLIGAKAGETRKLNVAFPKDYRVAGVAGKNAEFEVKIKAVKRRLAQKADDAFAKTLGFENLKALTDNIARQIESENAAISRAHLKRRLLDHLAAEVKFTVPATLVEREYQQIWERIKQDMLMHGEASADALKALLEPAEPKERKEYREIAERRVRLALLMGEIGRELDVKVTPEEVNQQIMFEAQRNPGHEREVLEFFKKNPAAYESAHAPVYEEKVVDIVLSKIAASEKAVSADELRAAFDKLDSEEGEAAPPQPTKAEAKAPAKKAEPAAAKAPAKKAAAKKAPAKKKKK